jgi:cytochrome bd ubiquinol oxidase subunit I
MENFDMNLVDWSRAQFALTAIYHWLFVPLTLGLSFITAIMESVYVKTGDPEWKRLTKFWMTLFGINFAIGVATGIILEFEFGTNWSNYSWFVGDIFGAPLAIEGIMAFFLESTFIAVMFFGWEKVSKRFHLVSTWLVAIGSNLSALWILVANGWMNYPAGMHFNPETGRNEMINFADVLFSPYAIHKFLHTISSGYVVASVFVIGISAWFLLKKREQKFARRSIVIASIFGLITSLYLSLTGDTSAKYVAQKQPMKFAAFEGLYQGQTHAPLVLFGIMNPSKDTSKNNYHHTYLKINAPGMLSFMAYDKTSAFIPGINDLIDGNAQYGVMSANERISRGKVAREALRDFQMAKESKDTAKASALKAKLTDATFNQEYFRHFGYGFFNNPKELIPHVATAFYSFHFMVYMGIYLILLFLLALWFNFKTKETPNWFLKVALWSIPIPYLASQAGWVLAEIGRQPWAIQDYLPTKAAVSHLSTSSVQITFWLFAAIFTVLLIAEIAIMVRQIKIGPKEGGH